ncbi:MAG: CoA ester lyase [Rhodospirillum sp.]|nr:CoA ester lyase [Rhodospirillum sp.]MCF8489701.1 CoA ester lyase [Rhodospirillum sp.]MCF8501676.1 CoA ester lyase [Rhodospirillum sp.]
MEKALASGADALILDLEDAVAPARKEEARRITRDFLEAYVGRSDIPILYVRVNALSTGLGLGDLAAVTRGRPHGIMVPKARGGADLDLIGHYLSALESRDGIVVGSIRLLPIVTELGAAMFDMGSYASASARGRLAGMLWGGEDLSADIGSVVNRGADGNYLFPFAMARALCLYAAAAAGVSAIDAVNTDFRDMAGLEAESVTALREGFSAKAAIHPAQVPVINKAFTPSAETIAWARRVVDAFAEAPEAGAVAVDGRMVDAPHLRLAQGTLARATG